MMSLMISMIHHQNQLQADVAQMVEQEFCKLQVVGSIPIISSNGAVAHLGERFPCTEEVASSILVSSTTIPDNSVGRVGDC